MRWRLTSCILLIGIMGCEPMASRNSLPPTETRPSTTSNVPPDRDNTGVNKRDQDSGAKTPVSQDENKRDIQITADIRKQVLAMEGMSVNARNAKIITSEGKVTLRGPVASADE